jgi:hypothetical protein
MGKLPAPLILKLLLLAYRHGQRSLDRCPDRSLPLPEVSSFLHLGALPLQAFTYCKLAFIFLFLLISPRFANYYGLYILIVWVVSRNPLYRGSDSGIVKVFSHEHFYYLLGVIGAPPAAQSEAALLGIRMQHHHH